MLYPSLKLIPISVKQKFIDHFDTVEELTDPANSFLYQDFTKYPDLVVISLLEKTFILVLIHKCSWAQFELILEKFIELELKSISAMILKWELPFFSP